MTQQEYDALIAAGEIHPINGADRAQLLSASSDWTVRHASRTAIEYGAADFRHAALSTGEAVVMHAAKQYD